MDLEKINYAPLAQGGDDGTAAFVKLEENFNRVGTALDGLHVGSGPGTVAAGDDPRFSMAGFRNKLINGDFTFWQRGLSTSANGYTSDRWQINSSGSTFTVQRAATVGDGIRSGYCMAVALPGVGSGFNIRQMIENVQVTAGRKYTLSFKVKGNFANLGITCRFIQNFGSGGSAAVAVAGKSFVTTTGWTRYSLTVDVPAVTGKTIGNGSSLAVIFDLSSAGTYYIAEVQFEEGVAASEFEQRPLGMELALCQRYYEKSFDIDTPPAQGTTVSNHLIGAVWGSTTARTSVIFKVEKRVPPAISFFRGTEVTSGGVDGRWAYFNGSWQNSGFPSIANVNMHGLTVDAQGNGLTTGCAYLLAGHWTADAEL